MRILDLIVGLAGVAACSTPAAPVVAPHAPTTSAITVPFAWIDNRVFVEVSVDGRGPFHFILDTGASDVTLADTTAAALGLAVTSQDPAVGVGEASVATGSAHVRELRLGSATLRELDASVLPLGDSTQVFGK